MDEDIKGIIDAVNVTANETATIAAAKPIPNISMKRKTTTVTLKCDDDFLTSLNKYMEKTNLDRSKAIRLLVYKALEGENIV